MANNNLNKKKGQNNNNNTSFLLETLEGNRNNNNHRGRGKNNNNMSEWDTFKNTSGSMINRVQKTWGGAPLPIKFGYIFVFGILLYYFTVLQYNFYGVIAVTILLSLIFLMTSVYLGVAFLIMMISVIFLNYKYRLGVKGYIIPTTEITKSGDTYKVYDGKKNHQFVDGQTLPPELTIGSYAYSFWLYVNKPEDRNIYRSDKWKSVFYRGTAITADPVSMQHLVQYPGVWIKPDNTTLAFAFQQPGATTTETVEIPSIEYGQWNHYVILCNPYSVAIYKNKKLEVTTTLRQTPFSVNIYGIYVTSDKMEAQRDDIGSNRTDPTGEDTEYEGTGFDGKLAYVTFHQTPLTPVDIENAYDYHKDMIDTYVEYMNKQTPTESTPIIM